MSRQAKTIEAYFDMNEDDEASALNFPPTEIYRKPTDEYLVPDPTTTGTFLYPSDYPRRDYQYEISQACFLFNTLVVLPTGLGKTFIAAVVMMNFHRWFPSGLIIFVAPTRPLATQQLEACAAFTQIPPHLVEIIMGGVTKKERINVYKEKKVIFATPQTINNDLHSGILDPCLISLLVIDEAHHSRGNYAYSQVVRKIAERNSRFRVVGLTATPGSNLEAIQAVIYNIMITKIISKDENDPDIAKYLQNKEVEIVTVPLGADESILSQLIGKCITYIAEPLQAENYIKTANPQFLSHGSCFMAMRAYQNQNQGDENFFRTIGDFGILLTLTRMSEKVTKYGTASLQNAINQFFKKKNTQSKYRLMNYPSFKQLMETCKRTKDSSHPKLAKLCVILDEFYAKKAESRAIIFTQFREVAHMIIDKIKALPNVRASAFIGQNGDGQDRKLQCQIVNLFRRGTINTIVATSVAEEGLDVGEVDLIICFDTQSSPLKTVQRMGRTGRKRAGKVIFLMAEGFEEKHLERAQNSRDYLKRKMLQLDSFTFYKPEEDMLTLSCELKCINLKCAQLKQTNKAMIPADMNPKKKHLDKIEKLEASALYGPKLKHRALVLDKELKKPTQIALMSHSSETNLLCAISSLNLVPNGETLDDEISAFLNDEDAFGINESEEEQTGNRPSSETYLSDDDIDFDEIDGILSNPTPSPTSYINDSDFDDIDFDHLC